jgi:hypothetical protein
MIYVNVFLYICVVRYILGLNLCSLGKKGTSQICPGAIILHIVMLLNPHSHCWHSRFVLMSFFILSSEPGTDNISVFLSLRSEEMK